MRTGTRDVLAQVGTEGAQNWFSGNVIPLLLFILGGVILWKGKGGDNAGAAKTFGPILMASAVLGIALTGQWEAVSRFVAGLFMQGG
ncbi:hypothetical protein SAMN04487819_1352 [Actinopolyspora alba]|uniref:TrbC/VIRB2 family protein n=1 Tax=Actinopolyspora alba TaxID=673379 RepID=A0A1I2CQW7_9ACTN|nr:hypothetical protein [Actinopolyspora alba]SFE70555.1 hypothetical protein SAMN04487819_1352 [Actinopolyspora alba]